MLLFKEQISAKRSMSQLCPLNVTIADSEIGKGIHGNYGIMVGDSDSHVFKTNVVVDSGIYAIIRFMEGITSVLDLG